MTENEQIAAEQLSNVHAERTILGAVLLDRDAMQEVMRLLIPSDFMLESHQRIARKMGQLAKAEQAIDLVTVTNELTKTHEIESVGGVSYLASLTEGLPRRPVIEDYIKIVKDKSVLRDLMRECSQAISRAADQGEPALELIGDLQKRLEVLTETGPEADNAKVRNFIVEVWAGFERRYEQKTVPAIPSGNAWFDMKSGGGYRHGKITIVAARPKVGKTGWFVSSAAYNLKRGRKVVMFSLEMERDEIIANLIPHFCDLPNVVVTHPELQTPAQFAEMGQAIEQILDTPLVIYDGDMDCDEVCWCIDRETKDEEEEVLFGLDHFGLMGGAGKDIRTRFVDNSNRLRKKIKHKKAALVALFQLLKVSRQDADKPPLPGDVKESGNPGEDCFAMLMLHRFFKPETVKMSTKAHLNLAFLRGGGSPGAVEGRFNTRTLSFEAEPELDYQDEEDF